MSRRKVAKTDLPANIRAWVKEFQGVDVVAAYRKHWSTSLSCAIVELSIAGHSFPTAQLEEARRKQVGAAGARRSKKAKKADARKARDLEKEFPTPMFDDEDWFIGEFLRQLEESETEEASLPPTNIADRNSEIDADLDDEDAETSWETHETVEALVVGPADEYDPFRD